MLWFDCTRRFAGPWPSGLPAGVLALMLAALPAGAVLAGAAPGLGGPPQLPPQASSQEQVAARVNGHTITQAEVDLAVQAARTQPHAAPATRQQMLEALIDRELRYARAVEQMLDRQPAVLTAPESRRKDVTVAAYVAQAVEAVPAATEDEIRSYFDTHPALFSQRRIYDFRQIVVRCDAAQARALTQRIPKQARRLDGLEKVVRASGLRHEARNVRFSAEQLPLVQLDAFAAMREGNVRMSFVPEGLEVLVLVQARDAPVGLELVRQAIAAFIVNERKRAALEADARALRAAAQIEYLGEFRR